MNCNEFVFELNRLLLLLENEKGYISNNLIYMNVLLDSNNYRGDITLIKEEISTYYLNLIKNIRFELIILNHMKDYVVTLIESIGASFFISTLEFPLFVSILKMITNSSTKRMHEVELVIYRYTNLFNTNSFNNHNYKIVFNEPYISDDKYFEMFDVISKVKK